MSNSQVFTLEHLSMLDRVLNMCQEVEDRLTSKQTSEVCTTLNLTGAERFHGTSMVRLPILRHVNAS